MENLPNMPKWIKIMLMIYGVGFGMYLLFSFMSATFDVKLWEWQARIFCVFFTVFFWGIGYVLITTEDGY